MLINDIDILRIEPRAFIDCQSAATKLLSASDGALAGTALTSAGSNFVGTAIDNRHVVVINGEALEVDSRTSATALEVSRARAESADAKIPPAAGSGLAFSIVTFERRILEEEAWVLGALGIDPAHPADPHDDLSIVDPAPVHRLIGLRVIASAYEVAASLAPADAALKAMAEMYRRRAREERHRTIAYIDRDGDGIPDTTRRIDVVQFTRA
jgi:hypothetical protein